MKDVKEKFRNIDIWSFDGKGDINNILKFQSIFNITLPNTYRDSPTTSEPKISLVIHDEYNDEIGKWLILPVANNFDDFLDSLYDFNERYPD